MSICMANGDKLQQAQWCTSVISLQGMGASLPDPHQDVKHQAETMQSHTGFPGKAEG